MSILEELKSVMKKGSYELSLGLGCENKFDRALAETLLHHYHQQMLNKK